VSTLRFRLTDAAPSVAIISELRKLTSLSIAELRARAAAGLPLMEITPFTNTWHDDRAQLVDIARRIESGQLPLSVVEVFDDESESPVSTTMLHNLIQHFREIELQTQTDTMLELGEIEAPSQFEPYDKDWTR
jgi:hypothetical protein